MSKKKDIFEYRFRYKPFEYPHLIDYRTAIRTSRWHVEEFDFGEDIQDFHTKLTEPEKNCIKNAMLAISQVEAASVKNFWGDIGKMFPKPEIEVVGATFSENECHAEGTEVLTPSGWIDFKNMSVGDKVMQYDMNTASITETDVKHITNKPFSGEMISYSNKALDSLVTPNHRMLFKTETGIHKELPAKYFNFHSNRLVPISGELSSESKERLSDMERLFIAIQADGNALKWTNFKGEVKNRGIDGGFNYRISVKKDKKKDRVRNLLNNLNIRYSEKEHRREQTCFSMHIDTNIDLKTFDWVNIENKSLEWCKEFIEELILWDGFSKNGKKIYISTNKSCVDKAQAVGICAGYNTHISKSEDNRKESYKTRYNLSFKSGNNFKSRTLRGEYKEYSGNVYCVTVDSGAIITRYNDRVLISGNCVHSESYSKLLEELGFNDEFDKLLENPVIEGRVSYLTKYLKNSGENKKQFMVLKLALFALFVENVSLFGQFFIIKSFRKQKNLLKSIDNVVLSTQNDECYVDGTEILTPSGWKSILDVNVGDDVYQWNDGVLEKVQASHTVRKQYKGDVIKFHKRGHQCIVTPNHNMVSFYKGERVNELAKDYGIGNSGKYIADSTPLNKDLGGKLSFFERLCVAIQADGTKRYWKNKDGKKLDRGVNGGYNYRISLRKDRKIDRLRWILSNLDIKYKESEIDNKGEIKFSLHIDSRFNLKEFDWVDEVNMDKGWAVDFCDEVSEWDGFKTGYKNNFMGYSTTNKKCADIFQHIAIVAGYRTILTRNVDNRKESYKDCFKVSVSKSNGYKRSHSLKKTTMPYDGEVGCVTVPSGVIITRHEGKTFVGGNCVHAKFGIELLNIVKSENPDWFNDDFYHKIELACKKAYLAEEKIVDWIFEKGDLDFLTAQDTKEVLKRRFNSSLKDIGCKPLFEEDEASKGRTKWFDEEIDGYIRNDFFNTKSRNYNKVTVKSEHITKAIDRINDELV